VSPVIPLIAITPRIDVTLAFFLLLAHLALLKAQRYEEHFNFAAVLLGMAIGIKHNAFLYGLSLTPLIFYLVYTSQNSWIKRINSLAVFCLIVLAA
jgi:4-amino-4-deoxy-L-arabinose transferase-like glycosyltransferase